MASLLLFVPSIFLTAISLSSFCSLNPYFAAILLSINIPVVPLSKSAFTIIPLCVSIFSIPIFNYTSFSILKVLLISFQLPPSFAMLFDSPGCVLPCYTFVSLDHAAFLIHLYYLCLSLIIPYLLFSFTWHPFSPYLLHCTYITITSFVYYPNSSRCASSSTPLPQCFSALLLNSTTKLLLHPCCASCGSATCAVSSSFVLLNLLFYASPFTGHTSLSSCCTFCSLATHAVFSFLTYNGHFLHLCPFSLYLKHSTSTTSTLLIMLSSTPHCIPLLFNISNLFWEMIVPFSPLLLFL